MTFKEGSPFGSSIGSRGNRGGSPADGMGGGGIQLTIQHLAGMELLTVLYMSMYLIIIIITIMLYCCSVLFTPSPVLLSQSMTLHTFKLHL